MAVLKLKPQTKGENGLASTHYEPIYELDGQSYGFRLYTRITELFDSPSDEWCFDIFDPDSLDTIVAGIKLTVGPDLLYPYKLAYPVPQGVLFVNDLHSLRFDPVTQTFSGDKGEDPKRDGFLEDNYELLYLEA